MSSAPLHLEPAAIAFGTDGWRGVLGVDITIERLLPVAAAAAAETTLDAVLAIRPLRVSPSYAGSEFVYRTGDVSLESDFYNEFFIPPGRLVSEEVRRWFEASGLFEMVVDSASPIESTPEGSPSTHSAWGSRSPIQTWMKSAP